ncbi:MAG: ribonuclease M5 [Candidatus Izemoplasmatales bacterium]
MRYNQVIVVEGSHDEQKLKSIYPEIDCIVTNGSEISTETLNLIYETSLIKEVILFLDPDYPGKRITAKIIDTHGIYKLAYITKDKAINKNHTKVGIEHASKEDLQESLSSLMSIDPNGKKISRIHLLKRGLISEANSALLRKYLCQKMNIPYANGKTFLKYLNILNIEIERIDELIHEYKSQFTSKKSY